MSGGPNVILVVDDDEANLYRKSHILRRAGYEVLTAADGATALRLVADHMPRLVVLDVKLPDIDGLEVCRRLKADAATASICVLQISATYVTETDTVRALEGGADACLSEPVDAPVLVATARALLRARVAEDALRDALEGEQRARQLAEEANHAKDEFLATLSHELRSPLGPILTWITLLKAGRLDLEKQRQAYDSIERNARMQATLIEDLLDVSRIVSGKLHIELADIDLAPVVEGALETVRSAAQSKSVTLEAHVDPAVGGVRGDAARLRQVVWNLLSNAIKFTPAGGHVTIALANRDRHAELTVTDSGEGIAPAFLPHVFERFRQADSSTTRRSSGLGLGLAIVRHLVELHEGGVGVTSDGPGRGATFTVRLPLRSSRLMPPAPAPAGLPASGAGRLRGIRILVVEDDRDAREALGTVLEECGATVATAGSVPEALQVIAAAPPDVLLSDIAMPGADGYALLAEVQSHNRTSARPIEAIAVTAHTSSEDQQRVLQAGYGACLGKPINLERLLTLIRSMAPA